MNKNHKPHKFAIHLFFYSLSAVITIAIAPFIGSEHLALANIFQHFTTPSPLTSIDFDIFFRLRLPRVFLGFTAGAALALSGTVLQAILRNPLATPYTLGTTAASAVGAYLSIACPVFAFETAFFTSTQLFAFIAAILAMLFIYIIANKTGTMNMPTLLLAGVTIGIICSALLLLIRYIAHPNLLISMDRWIMGSLDITGFRSLALILPMLLPGLGLLFIHANALNHISLGRELAIGLGVNANRLQKICFFATSLITAAVVSVVGPIAFVGLLIPHIIRSISSCDHRLILPASFLAGGTFLVICDTLARTVIAPNQIPTGIITALIGGVFFIYLLIKKL